MTPPFIPQIHILDITKQILSGDVQDITPTSTSFTEMLNEQRSMANNATQREGSYRSNRLEKARALYLRSLDEPEKVQASNLREMAHRFDKEELLSFEQDQPDTSESTLPTLSFEEELGQDSAMVHDMQQFVLSILNRTCQPPVPDGHLRQRTGPKLQHKSSEMFQKLGRKLKISHDRKKP